MDPRVLGPVVLLHRRTVDNDYQPRHEQGLNACTVHYYTGFL